MLSVIINTFNRPDRLERCLEALARQGESAPPCEVIVVDDGGTADLVPLEARYRDRMPLKMERIEHGGRSAARNRGLEISRGDRLLFLGDDVIAQPGLLARHWLEQEANVAVVGLYPLAGLSGSPPFRRWVEPNPQHEIQDHENAGSFFFATGNLSADRTRLLELGGFDPRFELYGWEDIDLGLRFERAGGRIRFDPEAKAIHDHPPFGRKDLWERERQMGFTAWQFAQKWEKDEPVIVARMKFWGDASQLKMIDEAGRLRRKAGESMIRVLDAIAPGSALNWSVYKRMIFSHRIEGACRAYRQNENKVSKR